MDERLKYKRQSIQDGNVRGEYLHEIEVGKKFLSRILKLETFLNKDLKRKLHYI